MDRLSHGLSDDAAAIFSPAALPLYVADEGLVERARTRLAVPPALHALAEIESFYDAGQRALWSYMRPSGRPSFTPALLGDFESWQDVIAGTFGPATPQQPDRLPLDFLILGSRSPQVFCFGGDLELFHALIRASDRDGLAAYGHRCVRILHRNMQALDLPLLTIGLVQGQALGGGFEAVLSFDVLIAERGATFGLPEVAFGLFPGMGAHSLLSRKLGGAMADRLILSNRIYSAEELYDLGLVTLLADPGEGVAATRAFMAKNGRRLNGMVAARRAMRQAMPLGLDELCAIVDIWADAAICLSDADLRLMSRLAGAQTRRRAAA